MSLFLGTRIELDVFFGTMERVVTDTIVKVLKLAFREADRADALPGFRSEDHCAKPPTRRGHILLKYLSFHLLYEPFCFLNNS